MGAALQKWYLAVLLMLAESYLDSLPLFLMGHRKGFQTAMFVEPVRIALLLAREWDMQIAVA
eukprot:1178178-Karenia_brevis.AAC.1